MPALHDMGVKGSAEHLNNGLIVLKDLHARLTRISQLMKSSASPEERERLIVALNELHGSWTGYHQAAENIAHTVAQAQQYTSQIRL